ncbi:hypothetical protein JEQ12_018572 [Ovis aries]|uniref:Ig-like domain-containing protein n=1 Tax=Ovis aries TaxID=9940 RepID=A0A836A1A2_SHEEP|nr:hypothetical protein JEQ12_018572 [Ovis aries]
MRTLSQSSSWLRRPEEEPELSLNFGARNNGQDAGSIILNSVSSSRLGERTTEGKKQPRAGTMIDTKTTQPSSVDCAEGENVNLPCNHSTIGGDEYIHWYRQNPNQSPQYVIHGFRGTVNSSMASLTIASDRKSSTLVLPQVTLRDAAVYYCALREAHWDRRGCTCAASLVGRRGDTAGRAVTRANLESSRRRVREHNETKWKIDSYIPHEHETVYRTSVPNFCGVDSDLTISEMNGQQIKHFPEFLLLQEGENFTTYCNSSSLLSSLQSYKQTPGGSPVLLMILAKSGEVKTQQRWTGTVINAKTTQPSSMDCAEGEDVNLPCNHSTIGGNDYIHWYRQNPNQSPQYVIHGLRGTVNRSMASLHIASDRKSSTLVLPQVTLRDAAVYYCVLREAHWDRQGCTCAVSLVARWGDRVGRAVTRANLESSRRRIREQ